MSRQRIWSILAVAVVTGLAFASAVSASPIIIDDGDAGYSRSGDGFYGPSTDYGYQGDYQWGNYVASNPAQATWQFSGLTAGTYDVYVTWPLRQSWADNADAASFRVHDGTTAGATLDTLTVNQAVAPVGITYNGVDWYKLGSYTISGAQLAVKLQTTATQVGTAIADGVMIEAVPEPAAVVLFGLGSLLIVGRRR